MANNSKSLRIRLIESAADLFIKNGYYNTTLKMIADHNEKSFNRM